MKILIVRPSANKMNLSTYNLQEVGLAKALIRKGHQCDVMYFGGKEKDHWETIKFDDNRELRILWIYGIGIFREGIYPSLKKYVNNYDIIQVGGHEGITSCWLNRHVQDKVVNYQGPYFYAGNKGYIKKAKVFDKTLLPLSHKNNMIVATKSVLASEYIKSKGIDDVTTIGVGLDLDNIVRSPEGMYDHEFIQKLHNRKGNGKYLLYIGVLEERRNIHFLLEVFKQVAIEIPDCKLVLIGRGKEEYVKSCFDKMKELGIQDKVIYREILEQKYMKAVYECSDAFLLPTRYEIFGMVILEAMYFGLPVFTTYNGGSSTLITEENGIVIKNFNKDEWAQKIVSVIDNCELANTISENAHRMIVENYTWDALADKFLSVYQKRLKSKK